MKKHATEIENTNIVELGCNEHTYQIHGCTKQTITITLIYAYFHIIVHFVTNVMHRYIYTLIFFTFIKL